jgi:hypothetical protein
VHDIAERWLDWKNLGPIASRYHALIADEVKADTRKLSSFEAFQQSLTGDPTTGRSGLRREISLKRSADQRRAYLLERTALVHHQCEQHARRNQRTHGIEHEHSR